jgi:formylglycine-generating enzyme
MVAPRGWLVPAGVLLLGSCAAWGLGASRQRSASSADATRHGPAIAAPQKAHVASAAAPSQSCPEEMTLVNDSCIDRYEAHLLKKGEGGALVPHPPYERPVGGQFVAESRPGVKPQAYISQIEAAAACENAGKRLCSLTDWYRACTGRARTTYPYGATYQAGRCNVGKRHLLSMLHGANAHNWAYGDFNDPQLDRRPGFLAAAGEYAGCVSTEGAYDLVGNLHEWVADRVDRTLRKKLPVPAVVQGTAGRHTGNGIFMGGFFSTLNQHGEGCDFVTTAHGVHYHDYSTGFRCCRDR